MEEGRLKGKRPGEKEERKKVFLFNFTNFGTIAFDKKWKKWGGGKFFDILSYFFYIFFFIFYFLFLFFLFYFIYYLYFSFSFFLSFPDWAEAFIFFFGWLGAAFSSSFFFFFLPRRRRRTPS